MSDMNFGRKLSKLRKEKGLSQLTLAKKLGYATNSYISEVESGKYLPSEKNLKKIAKILKVPFRELDSLLFEAKIRELGIKKPELLALFRDIPKLPEKDKHAIITAYLKIKKRKQKKKP